MNIVHVITRLIIGGAQENTLLTCEGLRARGHQVTLVTGPALGPEGQLLSRAQKGGYRVEVLDQLRREVHPRDWRACRRLKELLGQLRPDVVHTHSSKAGILGRQAAYSLRRGGLGEMKIVHTIHGLPFHRYGSRIRNAVYVALERRAARQSDAIISVADAMTRQALSAGVGRPEQYVTIYSGMEIRDFLDRPAGVEEFRRGLGLDENSILVTQVSRLAELKGHDYILDAAFGIDDPRIHFCFVGDGRRRGDIQIRIHQLGLAGRVHLTGLAPPEQVPLVMHACDILVHCSLREGLARTLPQAMLAGKPVVAFDVDGAREAVSERTGILLEPGDLPGLKLAISTLAESPQLRRSLGQAGRQLASSRFDHDLMVERIEQLYLRLLGNQRPA
jgi:glycosyltransferase involved in cell wall biosynthesis